MLMHADHAAATACANARRKTQGGILCPFLHFCIHFYTRCEVRTSTSTVPVVTSAKSIAGQPVLVLVQVVLVLVLARTSTISTVTVLVTVLVLAGYWYWYFLLPSVFLVQFRSCTVVPVLPVGGSSG